MKHKKTKGRSANWTDDERESLLSIVKPFLNTLENKKADKKSNTQKDSAWKQVEKQFTSKHRTVRTLTQLREQWKKLKLNARREWAIYSKAKKQTASPIKPSNLSMEIKRLIPREFIIPHNPCHDDESEMHINMLEPQGDPHIIPALIKMEQHDDDIIVISPEDVDLPRQADNEDEMNMMKSDEEDYYPV